MYKVSILSLADGQIEILNFLYMVACSGGFDICVLSLSFHFINVRANLLYSTFQYETPCGSEG